MTAGRHYQANGSPLRPGSLTHTVSDFLRSRGPTLYGLRYNHASHLLASKIHPKIVQERFGHSGIAITMDIYLHLMPNIQEGAAATVDGVLPTATKKRSKD